MRAFFRRVYSSAPAGTQSLLRVANGFVPDRIRFGPDFDRFRTMVAESETWSADRIEAWQVERLRELVAFAAEHVPYYRELFRVGGAPEVRDLTALRGLPTVTREVLFEHGERLRADPGQRPASELCHTGGSTGEPASFWLDKRSIALEKALLERHRRRAGWRPGERMVQLRGLATPRLVPWGQSLWLHVPGDRELVVSSIELGRSSVRRVVTKLRAFGATLLNAYPSAAVTLARLAAEEGVELPAFRGIVTASEPLDEDQREELVAAYRAPVLDHYGISELAVSAGECGERSGYHVCFEQGLLELLDADAGEEDRAEVVATSWWNRGQVLLRYRTGDLAPADVTREPCACGRTSPRLRGLEGRTGDLFETADGGTLSPATLNLHGGAFRDLLFLQFVQRRPGHAVARFVPRRPLGETELAPLRRELQDRFPEGFQLELELADAPLRTRRGKVPLLVRER